MKIEQVYTLVNSSTKDLLDEPDIVKQDLSNIVDKGICNHSQHCNFYRECAYSAIIC